jgi:hypothetical protein
MKPALLPTILTIHLPLFSLLAPIANAYLLLSQIKGSDFPKQRLPDRCVAALSEFRIDCHDNLKYLGWNRTFVATDEFCSERCLASLAEYERQAKEACFDTGYIDASFGPSFIFEPGWKPAGWLVGNVRGRCLRARYVDPSDAIDTGVDGDGNIDGLRRLGTY